MSQAGNALHTKFGLFEVNLQAGELRKQGLKLKLGRNALRVLGLLLQHPGELLMREETRQALWGADAFVTFDQGINKAIHELRQALGDASSNPNYIETVPGRGYRFIYSPPPPHLSSGWRRQSCGNLCALRRTHRLSSQLYVENSKNSGTCRGKSKPSISPSCCLQMMKMNSLGLSRP
jgi:DNA-binding winged helix-turn-helix (wHTH) protein